MKRFSSSILWFNSLRFLLDIKKLHFLVPHFCSTFCPWGITVQTVFLTTWWMPHFRRVIFLLLSCYSKIWQSFKSMYCLLPLSMDFWSTVIYTKIGKVHLHGSRRVVWTDILTNCQKETQTLRRLQFSICEIFSCTEHLQHTTTDVSFYLRGMYSWVQWGRNHGYKLQKRDFKTQRFLSSKSLQPFK